MTYSTIDKILEKLPYSDGSLRRRFVSGGIVLVGLFILFSGTIKPIIEKVGYGDILTSPMVAFASLLLIYALGNVVDMIGEIFFVRAASGVFWAFSFPHRHFQKSKFIYRLIGRFALWLIVPFIIIINVLKGLTGYTSYRNRIESCLTKGAKKIYSGLPEKVALGLSQPIGDNAEIAWKYIIEQFDNEKDQKWARGFITRAKDVLAVTTSLVIIFLGITFSLGFKTTQETREIIIPTSITKNENNLRNAIKELSNEEVRAFLLERVDTLDLESYSWLTPNEFRYLVDSFLHGYRISKLVESDYSKLRNIEKLADDLYSSIRTWQYQQYEEKIGNVLILWMAIFLSLSLFMFLYIAFFMTTRNAIISMLEVLAIKKPIPSTKK